MKQLLNIVFILVVCISCTSRTIYKKPDNLISKEKMIELWTDIFLANGARNIQNIHLEKRISYQPLVYKKYKIDSVHFMESNIYYTSKIEDYEKMFEEVEKRLRQLQEKNDAQLSKIDPNLPQHVKDSIRRSILINRGEDIISEEREN